MIIQKYQIFECKDNVITFVGSYIVAFGGGAAVGGDGLIDGEGGIGSTLSINKGSYVNIVVY